MNLRLILHRLLLCCVLLGAQQMGLTHALSHLRPVAGTGVATQANAPRAGTTASLRSSGNPQVDKACEQCLAFAQIDAMLASDSMGTLPVALPVHELPPTLQAGLQPPTRCVFQSRAPPASA